MPSGVSGDELEVGSEEAADEDLALEVEDEEGRDGHGGGECAARAVGARGDDKGEGGRSRSLDD